VRVNAILMLVGLSIVFTTSVLMVLITREYREIKAGDRQPSPSTYERISELYGWPQTFVGRLPG
jgi:hypothetical protein